MSQYIPVSRQQVVLLVATLLSFVNYGICTVKQLAEVTQRDKSVVADRLKSLTDLGYLEREHYRGWKLNVDRILALNKR